jgi:hypothetical protein
VYPIYATVWVVSRVKREEKQKWQINKHPKSFVRKLRILCGRNVLIVGIFQWFSSKGMHFEKRSWRIRAWSVVKSHRKYQVTEIERSRKTIKFRNALHSLQSCYCSELRLYSPCFSCLLFTWKKSFFPLKILLEIKSGKGNSEPRHGAVYMIKRLKQ